MWNECYFRAYRFIEFCILFNFRLFSWAKYWFVWFFSFSIFYYYLFWTAVCNWRNNGMVFFHTISSFSGSLARHSIILPLQVANNRSKLDEILGSKMKRLLLLGFLVLPGYVQSAICPMEEHQICNSDSEDHVCTCSVVQSDVSFSA